jgi:hypothetical protein
VTDFHVTNIQIGPSSPKRGNLLFHIDSNQQNVSYTVDLNFDFGARTVNRVRVWYPKRYTTGIESTPANVDNMHSNSYTDIDLLSLLFVDDATYQFTGSLDPPSALLTSNVSNFVIEQSNGLTDANITITASG